MRMQGLLGRLYSRIHGGGARGTAIGRENLILVVNPTQDRLWCLRLPYREGSLPTLTNRSLWKSGRCHTFQLCAVSDSLIRKTAAFVLEQHLE